MSERERLSRGSEGSATSSKRGGRMSNSKAKHKSFSSRSPRATMSGFLTPTKSPRSQSPRGSPRSGTSPRVSPMPSPRQTENLLFGMDLQVALHHQQQGFSNLSIPIFLTSVGQYCLENCARKIMEPLDEQGEARLLMLRNDIVAGAPYQFPRGIRSSLVIRLLAAFLEALPAPLVASSIRNSLRVCATKVSDMVAEGAPSSTIAKELAGALANLPEVSARVMMEVALIGHVVGLNGVHNGASFHSIANMLLPPHHFINTYSFNATGDGVEDSFMRHMVTYAPYVASVRGDRLLDQKSTDQILMIQSRVWLPTPHSDIVSIVHVSPFKVWALRANGTIVQSPGEVIKSSQPLISATALGDQIWIRGEMFSEVRQAASGKVVKQLAQSARCFARVDDGQVWGGGESQIIKYQLDGEVIGKIDLTIKEPVRFLCKLNDQVVVAAGKTRICGFSLASEEMLWEVANSCQISGLAASDSGVAYVTDIAGVLSVITASGERVSHQLETFPVNHLVITGNVAITAYMETLVVIGIAGEKPELISKTITYHKTGISGISLLGDSLYVSGADGSISNWIVGQNSGSRGNWRRTAGPSVFASSVFTGSTGQSINPSELEVDVKSVLGRGTFGLVYEGRWRGQAVAVKDLDLQKFNEEERAMFTEQMANVVTHSHALTVYCYSITGNRLRIVEDIAATDLKALLRDKKRKVRFDVKMRMAENIARCLVWMHAASPPICYLDLRSSNVLLDSNKRVLLDNICGVARLKIAAKVKDSSILYSFFRYAAPELLVDSPKISPAADVYSFAFLLWELVSARSPFTSCNTLAELRVLVCDSHSRPPIPKDIPAVLKETIGQCWAQDPEARPSIDSLLGVFDQATMQFFLKDPKSHKFWTNAWGSKRAVESKAFFEVLWNHMGMSAALRPYYTSLFSVMLVERKMVNVSSFADFFLRFADLERDICCAESVEDILCLKGFHGAISAEAAELMLKKSGEYLIRVSGSRRRNAMVLMVKGSSGPAKTAVIERGSDGFHLSNRTDCFLSLKELVANYKVKLNLKEPVCKSQFERIKAKHNAKKSILNKKPGPGEALPSFYVQTAFDDN